MATRSLRVLVVARTKGVKDMVPQLMQAPCELIEAPRPPFPKGMDLVVLERHPALTRFLTELHSRQPDADVVVLRPKGRLAQQLKQRCTSSDPGRMSYREIVQRSAAHVTAEYLKALLTRHCGNVTEAAAAAKVQRESLHRLLKRHGLKASHYRTRKKTQRR
jgi:DNA-binding NtrC family response regulator